MTTAIIGTGGIGSAIARRLASGGEALQLSSADEQSAQKLAEAIGKALHAWQFRDAWTERMRRGMAKDYSWEASAAAYQRMYAELASP